MASEPHYLSAADIDEMILRCAHAAPEFIPLLKMMRDFGLSLLTVQQDRPGRFWPRTSAPDAPGVLVYLSDSMATSKGPRAFHARSLKRLFRDCHRIVINAAKMHEVTYLTAGTLALTSPGPVVFVECEPSTQDQWIRFAKSCGKVAGDFVMVSPTVPGGVACEVFGRLPSPGRPEPTLH